MTGCKPTLLLLLMISLTTQLLITVAAHADSLIRGLQPNILEVHLHVITLDETDEGNNSFSGGDWQALTASANSFGFRDGRLLFRLQMMNRSSEPRDLLIEIAYPLLDSIEVYRDHYRMEQRMLHMGDGLPFADRPKAHRNFVVPIVLQPNERATWYYAVETSSAMQFPLRVWAPEAFYEKEIEMHLWFGAYYGVMLVMALYNLFVFLSVRAVEYLWYVGYVLAMIGFQAGIDGLAFQYLWPESVDWNRYATSVLVGALLFMTLLFQEAFLDLRSHSPGFFRINRVALYLSILLTLGAFVFPYQWSIRVAVVLTIATCVLALIAGYWVWYRGYTHARYYCLAWTVLIIGGIFTVLNMIGVLPRSLFTTFATPVGSLAEVVLLSFALAERINAERRLRHEAQLEALESERAARLMREDALRRQQQANEALEQRVHERTHELEVLNIRLLEMTATDQLTGLKNRRYLDQLLDDELIRCCRYQRYLGVLMIDIDHFKRFNDTWGHLAGDACLRAVATCIRAGLRSPSDRLARYGGEEFCVVLPETAAEGVRTVGERIRAMVEELEFRWENQPIHVTVSVGACTRIPGKTDTRERMIEWADEALYQSKQSGRNRVTLTEPMEEPAQDKAIPTVDLP